MTQRSLLACCLALALVPTQASGLDRAGPSKGQEGRVRATSLNLRQGPGTEHEVLRELDRGEEVTVLKREGAWIRVRTSSGKRGWVHSGYVDFAAEDLKGRSVSTRGRKIPRSLRGTKALASPSKSTKARYLHYRKLLAAHGYRLDERPNERTVIGLRGLGPEGRGYREEARPIRAYNDTFVVLWRDARGKRHVVTLRGSTTPGQTRTTLSGTPDADRDGVKDIAHLRPGLYRYKTGTYKGKSAFRPVTPTPAYRDTDHDGRIARSEKQRSVERGDMATGILFHRGRDTRPSSVGCQTLSPAVFAEFEAAIGGDTFDYVLIDPR